MKKYLITCAVVLVVAFVGGFLTSHFTRGNPTNAGNQELQEYNQTLQAQIQQAHREIENQHATLREMRELLDFYHRVVTELVYVFDNNTDLLHELMGEINDYRALINTLNTQIDALENFIETHENTIGMLETQVDNLQRELDFWIENGDGNVELIQDLIAQNSALLNQVANLQSDLQTLQTNFDNLFIEFNELTGTLSALAKDNYELNQQIETLETIIDELHDLVEYYRNRAPQVDYFFSDLGRTKNFVNPPNIMDDDNEVFLWEHFDTQIFLDMLLWEWGDPFFGPTLVGYFVAFEFTVNTTAGNFVYVVEIIHDVGFNPSARAFVDGVLQTQDHPRLFNITLTPVTFSYRFTPLPDTVEITGMYLTRLMFVHLAPYRGGGA